MKKLLLASLTLLGIVTNGKAAVGDTFVIDDLMYTVVTQWVTMKTGTVKVKANVTTLSGEITIPSYVEDGEFTYKVALVDENAFKNCKSITAVHFPNDITFNSSSGSMFSGCTGLTSFVFPESMTEIPGYMFENCTNLKSITIPEHITKIGDRAFQNAGLTSIVIPANVEYIESYAFRNCKSLTSITWSETLNTIPSYCFAGCTALTAINIPESVKTISSNAFNGCTKLNTINIGSNTYVGQNAFQNTKYVSSAPNGAIYIGANLYTTKGITAPQDIIVQEGTKYISYRAFYNNTYITTVTLPDGISSIGTSAFQGCTSLTSINFPESLTNIGESSFKGCTSLSSINIESACEIGSSFRDCTALSDITLNDYCKTSSRAFDNTAWYNNLDDGLAYIGNVPVCYKGSIPANTTINIKEGVKRLNGLTAYPENITEITLPSTLETIESFAFSSYAGLTRITIPKAVKSIGDYAFQSCTNLQEVVFENNTQLEEIGEGVFSDCSSLQSFTYPIPVTTVKNKMFYRCTSLTNINYTDPNVLEKIGNNAFFGCNSLNISLNTNQYPNLKEIGEEAFEHSGLTEVILSNQLGKIGKYVFCGCEKIRNMVLPTNLEVISDGFADLHRENGVCEDIEELFIPKSVKTIGKYAFAGWQKVKKLTFEEGSNLETIGEWALNGLGYQTAIESLEIPASCKEMGTAALYNSNIKHVILNGIPHSGAWDRTYAETIVLPVGLPNITDGELAETNVRQLDIPNSVKYMGGHGGSGKFYLMHGSYAIKHLTLPSHLTDISCYSFGDMNVSVNSYKYPLKNWQEITFPANTNITEGTMVLNNNMKLFIMGDEIPANVSSFNADNPITIYVKESVYREKYPDGTFTDANGNTCQVDYRIPVTMGTSTADNSTSNFKSMCRDFDADFSDPNVTDPELKVWLAADYNGNSHNVMMQQLNYVPSRLKANVTDPETGELYQGVDEYVGIILEGTPGKTYYYKMGEHDYTQGAEGQWLLEDAQQNFLVGANDDHYVNTTTTDKTTQETKINYGLKNGYFKKYVSEGFINYNKSFLSLPEELLAGDENYEENNAKGLGFEFYELDGTTRILSAEEFSSRCEDDIFNGRTYNLQGQAVGDDYKGFVIQNGKKFIRK